MLEGSSAVVVVVVEASTAKADPRVTLASTNTFSGSIVSTKGVGKGFQGCSLQLHRACGTSAAIVRLSAAPHYTQGAYGRFKENDVGFRLRSVAGSKVRKEDRL